MAVEGRLWQFKSNDPEKQAAQEWRRERAVMRGLRREHKKEIVEARKALRAAEKTYAARVEVAQKEVSRVAAAREKAVEVARKHLVEVVGSREKALEKVTKRLGYLRSPNGKRHWNRGVTLLEHRIRAKDGETSLVNAQAIADPEGNLAVQKRPTLTRMAGGGLLLGPLGAVGSLAAKKSDDTRELYLLIETSAFASVIGRMLAAPANRSAVRQNSFEENRPGALETAELEYERLFADMAAIDWAQTQLSAVESDEALLEAIRLAQEALDAAQADTTDVETCRERLKTLQHRELLSAVERLSARKEP